MEGNYFQVTFDIGNNLLSIILESDAPAMYI